MHTVQRHCLDLVQAELTGAEPPSFTGAVYTHQIVALLVTLAADLAGERGLRTGVGPLDIFQRVEEIWAWTSASHLRLP